MDQQEEIPVRVVNGFGARSQQPFVCLVIGDSMFQFDPEKAREIAGLLLACAEAADQDAFLVQFHRERVGLDEDGLWAFMHMYRQHREQALAKRKEGGE